MNSENGIKNLKLTQKYEHMQKSDSWKIADNNIKVFLMKIHLCPCQFSDNNTRNFI